MMCRLQTGFTLIELMIVVAIVGVLAALAMPNYQHYLRKAVYAEVVTAMIPPKAAVELCYQLESRLTHCDTVKKLGMELPGDNGRALKAINLIAGTAQLVATPNAYRGISMEDTCSLHPEPRGDALVWSFAGACLTKGYVRN